MFCHVKTLDSLIYQIFSCLWKIEDRHLLVEFGTETKGDTVEAPSATLCHHCHSRQLHREQMSMLQILIHGSSSFQTRSVKELMNHAMTNHKNQYMTHELLSPALQTIHEELCLYMLM